MKFDLLERLSRPIRAAFSDAGNQAQSAVAESAEPPAGPAEAPADDKRGGLRRRALKEAKVVLRDWSTIDCALRDFSEEGARLGFKDPVQLPGDFKLLLPMSEQIRPAELVWQRGLLAGIRFTGPARAAPPRNF